MILGNSKAIDLVVTKEPGGTHRTQVKALRSGPNCFTLHTGKVKSNDSCVFAKGEKNPYPVRLIIHGASLGRPDLGETVNHEPLQKHKNQWNKLKQ